MITTGFTYRGVHSSDYHIVCDPSTRQILPEKRRMYTEIPGRSGSHMQTDGTYSDKVEEFHCYFTNLNDAKTISELAREIALWLSADGQLCFDNEPDKFYDAFYMGAPPMEKHLRHGAFDLTFGYSPPFAYTAQQSLTKDITSEATPLVVPVLGSAATPVRLYIRNTGNTTIQNIRITRFRL